MYEQFSKMYPNYTVTQDGKVFKDGKEMKPFKSNKYLQVLLYDVTHTRHIFGVHTLVAMLYLEDFYTGCIVHHKDKNCHNNKVENLEIMSQSEHARMHGKEYCALGDYIKKHGPWNKGKPMPISQREKLSIIAMGRKGQKGRKFRGNQYVDAQGNRKN